MTILLICVGLVCGVTCFAAGLGLANVRGPLGYGPTGWQRLVALGCILTGVVLIALAVGLIDDPTMAPPSQSTTTTGTLGP